jgi:hypothetical protein
VTDNLFRQGTISVDAVGVYFAPTSTLVGVDNGELTFGGPDKTKYTGKLQYVPLTKTSPSKYYWGIDQSLDYGSTPLLNNSPGIVDTVRSSIVISVSADSPVWKGTTLIYLANDAYNKYKSATGATLDPITGLLRLPASEYSSLSNLTFNIGSSNYTLTPNGQIWPRAL